MKLPDAVIDKLQDGESPVTHAAIIEGGDLEPLVRGSTAKKRFSQCS
jgi:hypothetical protein